MVLRQSAQMVFGQLLPQKDVVAVVALHDAADLAGLEGEGSVLELLDEVGVRIDEIARAALPAALGGVVRSEALDGIDIGALYTAYIDALQTLHPAEEQEPADNGSGEDGTEAGSPDSTDGTAE